MVVTNWWNVLGLMACCVFLAWAATYVALENVKYQGEYKKMLCEQELPRKQHCKIVVTAVVDFDD